MRAFLSSVVAAAAIVSCEASANALDQPMLTQARADCDDTMGDIVSETIFANNLKNAINWHPYLTAPQKAYYSAFCDQAKVKLILDGEDDADWICGEASYHLYLAQNKFNAGQFAQAEEEYAYFLLYHGDAIVLLWEAWNLNDQGNYPIGMTHYTPAQH